MNIAIPWKPQPGFLRWPEYLAMVLILVSLLTLCYLYWGVFKQTQAQFGQLQTKEQDLRAEIKKLQLEGKKAAAKLGSRQLVIDNVQSFNERFLKDPRQGQLLLIERINKLVLENNLVLESTLNFLPEGGENADKANRGNTRRGPNEEKSLDTIYPSLKISFNVSGSYDRFRKFLYDLESNDLFIVIDEIGLSKAEKEELLAEGATPASTRPSRATNNNNPRGELSVQVTIHTYFRRDDLVKPKIRPKTVS
jgi:Tfp pilus assembly protein PilO